MQGYNNAQLQVLKALVDMEYGNAPHAIAECYKRLASNRHLWTMLLVGNETKISGRDHRPYLTDVHVMPASGCEDQLYDVLCWCYATPDAVCSSPRTDTDGKCLHPIADEQGYTEHGWLRLWWD